MPTPGPVVMYVKCVLKPKNSNINLNNNAECTIKVSQLQFSNYSCMPNLVTFSQDNIVINLKLLIF